MVKQNLIGKRFGKILITKEIPSSRGRVMWEGICDCGNVTTGSTSAFNAGDRRSCGCGIIRYDDEMGNVKQLFRRVKQKAELRNLEFTITLEEFIENSQKDCDYCGIKPYQIFSHTKNHKFPFIYNGMDRVNNHEGYTPENIVPCCGVCNIMKGRLTKETFLEKIKKICNHVRKI